MRFLLCNLYKTGLKCHWQRYKEHYCTVTKLMTSAKTVISSASLCDTVLAFQLKTSISIARSFLFYQRSVRVYICLSASQDFNLASCIPWFATAPTGFPLPWKRIRPAPRVINNISFLADLPQRVMKTQIIYARRANFELLFCLRVVRLYLYTRPSMRSLPCSAQQRKCKQSFAANGGLCKGLMESLLRRRWSKLSEQQSALLAWMRTQSSDNEQEFLIQPGARIPHHSLTVKQSHCLSINNSARVLSRGESKQSNYVSRIES